VLLTYSHHQRDMIYAINAETDIVLARHIFVYSTTARIFVLFLLYSAAGN